MSASPIPAPFPGKLVVVSGQCRKIGKTALVVDLIRALREFEWTAIKITPHAESGCPLNGAGCGCAPHEHTFAIREEKEASDASDTARFLAGGARRALWVETKSGRLGDALAALARTIQSDPFVIVESNAILEFWRPNVCLMVVDPARAEFKESGRTAMAVADAFVLRSPRAKGQRMESVPAGKPDRPEFVHSLGGALPEDVQSFIRQRLARLGHPI